MGDRFVPSEHQLTRIRPHVRLSHAAPAAGVDASRSRANPTRGRSLRVHLRAKSLCPVVARRRTDDDCKLKTCPAPDVPVSIAANEIGWRSARAQRAYDICAPPEG